MQFPKNYLPTDSMKWGRAVEAGMNSLEKAISNLVNRDGNTSSSGTATLARLSDQLAEVQSSNEKLVAAGLVQYAENTPGANVDTGFYNGGRPSVRVISPTGRIEVQFGGAMNSGNGAFVFSVDGTQDGVNYVDRNAMSNNLAQRVGLSGGVQFTPSGYKTAIVTVPANTPLTVTAQYRAFNDGTYLAALSVLARAAI